MGDVLGWMLIFGVQFRVLSDTVEPGIEGIWLGLICSDAWGRLSLDLLWSTLPSLGFING